MDKLLFRDEVYKIVGLCMDVYIHLGYGFAEIVYKDAMEAEFRHNGLEYNRERKFPVTYKGKDLRRTFFVDFLVYDEIIVEVKANGEGIFADMTGQLLNYLKVSGKRLGIIVNFGKRKLEFRRIIL